MSKEKAMSKQEIENSTKEIILKEWEECMQLWGRYSCDCFGFYIHAVAERIVELGGWTYKPPQP